jgi:hypothetical protein
VKSETLKLLYKFYLKMDTGGACRPVASRGALHVFLQPAQHVVRAFASRPAPGGDLHVACRELGLRGVVQSDVLRHVLPPGRLQILAGKCHGQADHVKK